MDIVQIQAKFITKQTRFAIPSVPISISILSKKTDLNAIINQILYPEKDVEDYVIFDFLIDGEILYDETLEEHFNEKNLTTEESINIEYVERQPSPSVGEWLQHDNWISSARTSQELILCGTYDGLATIWTVLGQKLKVIEGHQSAVKSVAWLQDDIDEVKQFATASDDGTTKMWSWNRKNGDLKLLHVCPTPEQENSNKPRNVQCIASNPNQNMFATGSWDSAIQIWSSVSTQEASNDEPQEKKKRKIESENPLTTRLPIRSFWGGESGHKNVVSSVDWTGDSTLCSASWDHTIKTWDVHTAQNTATHTGSKIFLDISYSRLNNCLATASCDRHIRIYDQRIITGSMIKSTLTSHKGWVSSVHWSSTDKNHFISSSYDCVLKLWDIRSPKAPLYDMGGHEDKILCCDWSEPNYMISGGSDKKLRIFCRNDSDNKFSDSTI